ncbi:MAG: ABC transporter permease [Candidatus Hydrogenedentes bacterium]|nr:ABC transporter permease [Candidatus Hydrogenedentota bacterium]
MRQLYNSLGLAAVLALLIAFFGFQSEYFLTWGNFVAVANQIPDALLIAIGMTFVLIIGEIDLSVGAVLALCGAVLGVAMVDWGLPFFLAVPITLAVGAACGLANGLITVRWQLPSFIVTLGMMEVARGAAYMVTDSTTIYIGRPVDWLMGVTVADLSVLFFGALVVAFLAQGFLSMTIWGRGLLALGSNTEAARLSGISTSRLKVLVFVGSGVCAALASIVLCARLSSADPNMGMGYELYAIAAVVVGGTSLLGGRGSVVNTVFGVLTIAILGTGLVQIDVEDPVKRIVTGTVVVVAVIVDYYRGRMTKQ